MDMIATIVPKSDQLNSDDLIGRDMTIKVTRVTLDTTDEQPVALYFEGDGGKPYKPGKSMRRVLVHCWGPDAGSYAGRSLTIYRDADVKFGGMEVGGIRISAMSHIAKRQVMALTATRGNKKPFVVEPLRAAAPAKAAPPGEPPGEQGRLDEGAAPERHDGVQEIVRELGNLGSEAKLAQFQRSDWLKERLAGLEPAEEREVTTAVHATMRRLAPKPGAGP